MTFILAKIRSDSGQGYSPRLVREMSHGPLVMQVAKYLEDGTMLSWMEDGKLYADVPTAKAAAVEIYRRNPEWLPPALRAH
jgi:hypothetical protein